MATSEPTVPDDPMKVLVHIANYNSEAWIRDAIESILAQTHQNWGLLIIDDGSTDSSPTLIREFIGLDDRIRCLSNKKNIGTARVHNLALDSFNSELEWDAFCILDCDDVALPDWLSCGVLALRSGAIGLRPILSRYDEELQNKKWDYIGCNQTFWSREVISELGNYRLKPHMYDHDFMERAKRYAVLKNKSLRQSNVPMQKMRMRGDNQSLQEKSQEEIQAEKLSVAWARSARSIRALFFKQDA